LAPAGRYCDGRPGCGCGSASSSTEAARHRVDRDDMGSGADGLDILFFAKTGSDDFAKPSFAETPGIGPHAMHHFDDEFRRSVNAVVLPLYRGRRQRLLAPTAWRAPEGVTGLGGNRDASARPSQSWTDLDT
jgi:hypothetical protein